MSKPDSARYRTTNWSSYNASLRKRGFLLIWVDKDMTWRAPRDGRPGRPAVFSDAAIQFCLSIKVLFKLPLRQTAGMVASLLRLAGLDWPVPDFSTLCRGQHFSFRKSLKRCSFARPNAAISAQELDPQMTETNEITSNSPRSCRALLARGSGTSLKAERKICIGGRAP
jgi:hypothetical protein